MCTLSWLHQDSTLYLVFSRDESLQRVTAEPPQRYTVGTQTVLAPKDPQGQGFWIASNLSGLTVCVLNDYGCKAPQGPFRSRGQLVRDLSASETPAEINSRLQQPEHHCYAPCFLVVFWQSNAPVLWHWNGDQWAEKVAPVSPLSTTSLFPTLIPKIRRFLFDQSRRKDCWSNLTPEQQLNAHRTRWRGFAWASIAMRRQGRATVSLTRVTVNPGHTRMEYWQGDPTQASTPVCLDLQTFENPLADTQPISMLATAPIQLEEMLAAKNPELYRQLKGVPLYLLKWVTRVDWLNRQLMTVSTPSPRRFPPQVLNRLGVSAQVSGHTVLPSQAERPVFLANHPTGGLDGLILLAWLQNHYPKVRVVVTDLLNTVPALAPLWIPVDRYQSSRQAVRKLHQAFADDAVLLVFPAGRTARRQDGRLTDFPWHAMPVSLAQRAGRCVVPVHLEAQNSWRFYALAWLRQRLGLSLNIEMALLTRELLKPATKEFGIVVGASVSADRLMTAGTSDADRTVWIRTQYEQLVWQARNKKTLHSTVSTESSS